MAQLPWSTYQNLTLRVWVSSENQYQKMVQFRFLQILFFNLLFGTDSRPDRQEAEVKCETIQN